MPNFLIQWTTDQQLEDLLSKFGKIKTLKFFEDKVNGKSKGYEIMITT
jgi:cleavage and polyadenylation specificity factor subunit 6/7